MKSRKDGLSRPSAGMGSAHPSDRQGSITTSKALGKNGLLSTRSSATKSKGSGRLQDNKYKQEASSSRIVEASPPRESFLKISTGLSSGLSTEKEEGEISATPLSHHMKRLPGSRGIANAMIRTPSASHSNSPAPQSIPQPGKKGLGPVDVRGSRNERPPPSGTARPAPPLAPPPREDRKTSNSPTVTAKKDKLSVSSSSKSECKEADKIKNISKPNLNAKQPNDDDIGAASGIKAAASLKRGRMTHEQNFEEGEPARKKVRFLCV